MKTLWLRNVGALLLGWGWSLKWAAGPRAEVRAFGDSWNPTLLSAPEPELLPHLVEVRGSRRGAAHPPTAHHTRYRAKSRRASDLTCPGNREYSLSSDKSTGIWAPEECSRSPSRITDLLFSFPLVSQPIWPSRVIGSYGRCNIKMAVLGTGADSGVNRMNSKSQAGNIFW